MQALSSRLERAVKEHQHGATDATGEREIKVDLTSSSHIEVSPDLCNAPKRL
jgi:hypothetical protein